MGIFMNLMIVFLMICIKIDTDTIGCSTSTDTLLAIFLIIAYE